MSPTIVAIVEGRGDEQAIRVLLQNWLWSRQIFKFDLKILVAHSVTKILVPHNEAAQHGVEYFVSKAQTFSPDAIVVLLDADDECGEEPKYRPPGTSLGPWLLSRAKSIVDHILISVVVADRCFESWFFEPPCQAALAEHKLFLSTDLSTLQRAKGRFKDRLSTLMGRAYSESADQGRLAMHLPLAAEVTEVSPSFRKLRRELAKISDRLAGAE